jgi:hypothetical protein
MSNWRRKHILMAENDSDPKAAREYDQAIHGKITSFEDVLFEPEEAPTNIIFSVATEKDTENAKDITVPFEKFAKWANGEGFDLEDENASRDAGKKYFEEYYSNYLTDEGRKSLRAQMQEDIDLGHEDDEPHMIKADLYRIGKYAMELYAMADKLEKSGQEIDFPAWWQAMITDAKEQMVKAKHYLDFELNEPAINASVDTMSLYEKYTKA